MTDLPQVCELCGESTPATSIFWQRWPDHYTTAVSKAKRCAECFLLEGAIKKRPEVARKILKDLEIG